MERWSVVLQTEFEAWLLSLAKTDPASVERVQEAIQLLADHGPLLGRPLVDRINGSRHHNMKELRPPSPGGSAIRVLFAFDPKRSAVLLLGGDKAGNWRRWYRQNIPIAMIATTPTSRSWRRRRYDCQVGRHQAQA